MDNLWKILQLVVSVMLGYHTMIRSEIVTPVWTFFLSFFFFFFFFLLFITITRMGKVNPSYLPLLLKSSTNIISCMRLSGDLFSTLCTVRFNVDSASLWNGMTTEAFGSLAKYLMSLHL